MNVDEQRIHDWNQATMQERIDHYATFLKDNDFETYQPKTNGFTKSELLAAHRSAMRILWILSRFWAIGSPGHQYYVELYTQEYNEIEKLNETL